ncbi:peptidylprolyl isomerase, partial [Bacteroidota bacterium]
SSGGGTNLFGGRQTEIAEINGKSISYFDYENRLEYVTEVQKLLANTNALDEQTMEQIREQNWQQIVREQVMSEEYENVGIAVHSEEVYDMVQGTNIHPYIIQLFADPQTGQINRTNILQFLKTMDQDPSGKNKAIWLYLEKEMITERKFSKYLNLIQKGLYTTDLQAENYGAERQNTFTFRYMTEKYRNINDSLISFTESDIKNYYNDHKNEYKQEESRNIQYVTFEVLPSEEDEKATQARINSMKNEFEELPVEEDRDYINLNSDSEYDANYYKKEELSEEIQDFSFNNETGAQYGPFFEENSYKIVKINDIRYIPDSVKARHILIRVQNRNQGIEEAQKKADSLLNEIKRGADFGQLAQEFSGDMGSAQIGGDLGWFTQGTMVQVFNDACFFGNIGDLTTVESQFGIHLIEIQDQTKKYKKVRLDILERRLEPSTETYQHYYSLASEFAGQHQDYQDFMTAFNSNNYYSRTATEIKRNDRDLPGLENAREIVRWAFSSKEKAVSGVFEVDNNFIVAALTKSRNEGYTPLEDVKTSIINEVKKQKKAEYIIEKILNQSYSDLDELSNLLKLKVNEAQQISFSSFSFGDAGFEPNVIATASALQQNELSDPIIGNNGVYVIQVTEINSKVDQIDIVNQKNFIQQSLRQRIGFEPYEALKKLAEIEDNRSNFF